MTTTKQHLTHLESTGLLRLAQTQPELEYFFRHALVQDAAYESLLLADRKRLHLKVGKTIEQMYPDQVASSELAPVLAHHFSLAGDDKRALKYFTLAGDAATAEYANIEAVMHYTHALELTRQTKTGSNKLIHLYISLGRVFEVDSKFEQALTTYQEMEQLAKGSGDLRMELTSLTAQAILYSAMPTVVHDPIRGKVISHRALSLANELDDQAAEAKILWNLLHVYRYIGNLSQAADYGERSLTLARKFNLKEQMAYSLHDLGIHCYRDQIDQAKTFLSEARKLWRELGNLPMLADNLSSSCLVCILAGEYDRAVAFSDEAFQVSQTIDNLWGQALSRWDIGRVYWERGQSARAIAVMNESIYLSEVANVVDLQLHIRRNLVIVYCELGAIELGIETGRRALGIVNTQYPTGRATMLQAMAKLYLVDGNLSESETAVKQSRELNPDSKRLDLIEAELAFKQGKYDHALKLTETLLANLPKTGVRIYLPKTLYFHGKALLVLGEEQKSREHLQEARAEAEAIGSRRMLWQILAALAEIETDPTEATFLRQQAQEIVEYIAEHTPSELRASFLNLPDVRAVMKEKP